MSRLSDILRRLANDLEDKPDDTAIAIVIDGEYRTLSLIDQEHSGRMREFFDRFVGDMRARDINFTERDVPLA